MLWEPGWVESLQAEQGTARERTRQNVPSQCARRPGARLCTTLAV